MIKLYIGADTKESEQWKEMLKEWCVAHEIVEEIAITEPELRDGTRHAIGTEAINQFLKDYKVIMDDWYDCRCDKWQES